MFIHGAHFICVLLLKCRRRILRGDIHSNLCQLCDSKKYMSDSDVLLERLVFPITNWCWQNRIGCFLVSFHIRFNFTANIAQTLRTQVYNNSKTIIKYIQMDNKAKSWLNKIRTALQALRTHTVQPNIVYTHRNIINAKYVRLNISSHNNMESWLSIFHSV